MVVPQFRARRARRATRTLTLLAAALAAVGATACQRASTAAQPEGAATTIPARTGSVTVTGRVTDSTGAPVAGARVNIEGTDAIVTTGADGRYTLTGIPDGPQRVVIRHAGYAPVAVDAKFSTKPSDWRRNVVNVVIPTRAQAAATAMTRAQVDSELARVGFFQRQQRYGRGTFLTLSDIQSLSPRPQSLTDVLRQIPQIAQFPTPWGGTALRGMDGCLVVYVDGILWRPIIASDLNAEVPLSTVAGIEAYVPGVMPSPFNGWPGVDRCDVLGVWTRGLR